MSGCTQGTFCLPSNLEQMVVITEGPVCLSVISNVCADNCADAVDRLLMNEILKDPN